MQTVAFALAIVAVVLSDAHGSLFRGACDWRFQAKRTTNELIDLSYQTVIGTLPAKTGAQCQAQCLHEASCQTAYFRPEESLCRLFNQDATFVLSQPTASSPLNTDAQFIEPFVASDPDVDHANGLDKDECQSVCPDDVGLCHRDCGGDAMHCTAKRGPLEDQAVTNMEMSQNPPTWTLLPHQMPTGSGPGSYIVQSLTFTKQESDTRLRIVHNTNIGIRYVAGGYDSERSLVYYLNGNKYGTTYVLSSTLSTRHGVLDSITDEGYHIDVWPHHLEAYIDNNLGPGVYTLDIYCQFDTYQNVWANNAMTTMFDVNIPPYISVEEVRFDAPNTGVYLTPTTKLTQFNIVQHPISQGTWCTAGMWPQTFFSVPYTKTSDSSVLHIKFRTPMLLQQRMKSEARRFYFDVNGVNCGVESFVEFETCGMGTNVRKGFLHLQSLTFEGVCRGVPSGTKTIDLGQDLAVPGPLFTTNADRECIELGNGGPMFLTVSEINERLPINSLVDGFGNTSPTISFNREYIADAQTMGIFNGVVNSVTWLKMQNDTFVHVRWMVNAKANGCWSDMGPSRDNLQEFEILVDGVSCGLQMMRRTLPNLQTRLPLYVEGTCGGIGSGMKTVEFTTKRVSGSDGDLVFDFNVGGKGGLVMIEELTAPQ